MDDIGLPHSGTVESRAESEKSDGELAKRWLAEIELASKEERHWRKAARKTVARYRDESQDTRRPGLRGVNARYNILWANIEILKPSLYSQTPQPDVRRRYSDPDPLGKVASEMTERGLSYALDAYDFDHTMELAVIDLVLPGRSVVRIRYRPALSEDGETKTWETAECEYVPWTRFRRGSAGTWEEMPWIAYEHLQTRDELTDAFGEIGKRVELDVVIEGHDDDRDGDRGKVDVYKRGRVWEIWDKLSRQIVWIAPSVPDKPLQVEDDKLGLEGFYDTPRPMYAVETTDSLVPIEEYRLYRDQAEELDRITRRIQRVVEGLKLRGIYDSTLSELATVMRGEDNDLIPSDTATSVLAITKDLSKHIWMMPISDAARVLVSLYEQREQIKNTIYEIMGLSDIMRGASDPNETLGAQQIKAQSGSVRLQRRTREVQRYARDLIRMKAEIMAEHFAPETWAVMTGMPIELVSQALPMLREDGPRGFRIDIETDSTIVAESAADQQNMAAMLAAIGGFVQAVGPAVQIGAIPLDAAKTILMSAVRKMKLGRKVEDALDQADQAEQQPQGEAQPDPAAMAAAQEAQTAQQGEMARLQAEQQGKADDLQFAAQKEQLSAQFKDKEIGIRERDQALKEADAEHSRQMDTAKMQIEFAKLADGVTARGEGREDADVDVRAEKLSEVDADMKEMAAALMQLAEAMQAGFAQQAETNAAIVEAIAAPKELVRDDQGRPSGVRVVLN